MRDTPGTLGAGSNDRLLLGADMPGVTHIIYPMANKTEGEDDVEYLRSLEKR